MGLIDFIRDAAENILEKVGDLFTGGEEAEKKAAGALVHSVNALGIPVTGMR